MAVGRILVIAPDPDLRQSLAFMLEADGYAVEAAKVLSVQLPLTASRFDAIVLDEKALAGADEQTIDRSMKTAPVVLLAERPHPRLVEMAAEVVEIPAIGNAVSLAVRRAMQERV